MTPTAAGAFLLGTATGFLAGFATGIAAGLGMVAAMPTPPRVPPHRCDDYVPHAWTVDR